MSISPLAYVHPDARLGKDVTVEPFASVYGDVVIGDGTWIGPNSVLLDGARVGRDCKIFPGAVIAAIPQDLKFAGEKTTAEVGDGTTIRECVTLNRGTADRTRTVVGDNCLLMAYVHLAHDCIVGNNVVIANSVNLALPLPVVLDDHGIAVVVDSVETAGFGTGVNDCSAACGEYRRAGRIRQVQTTMDAVRGVFGNEYIVAVRIVLQVIVTLA